MPIKKDHIVGPKMMKELVAQYSREMHSALVYYDLAAVMERDNYLGFSKFLQSRAQEEIDHAHKFFVFISDAGGLAKLTDMKMSKIKDTSIVGLFKAALEHEQFISDNIYRLKEIANKLKEHPTNKFLMWFVEEQVEEEASLDVIITNLERAKGNEAAILEIEEMVSDKFGGGE